jgi:pyruvate/2-oxoglutarate dehydrogenase complex dihydrolipoamide acyltransferase (E2) component
VRSGRTGPALSTAAPLAAQRRHTYHFLRSIRECSPVFLDTEVEMSRVRAHRAAAHRRGRQYSTVSYLLYAGARVLARHPGANAAIRGRLRPRVARYESVDGKLTLDKTLHGERVVFSVVLRRLHQAGLDDIQRQVDRVRHADPAAVPELAPARALQRLPVPLGALAFRLGVRPLRRRAGAMGTFAVTSLGQQAVDGFYSVGGTTLTLGAGRTMDRPVASDGRIVVAPVMRLALTFDHRVIDGAEAAEILTEIKDDLESFSVVTELVPATAEAAGADQSGDAVREGRA